MGNGRDIGPNGYGPNFRPGLNYPTIYDDDEEPYPLVPRPWLPEAAILIGTEALWVAMIGGGFLMGGTAVWRGDAGGIAYIAMSLAGIWFVAGQRRKHGDRRGWVPPLRVVLAVAACFQLVWKGVRYLL